MRLILLLVKEKVIFGRIVRPDVLYRLVVLPVILELLEILNHLFRSAGTVSIIYKFFFACRPWSIVQAAGQFECPIHSLQTQVPHLRNINNIFSAKI